MIRTATLRASPLDSRRRCGRLCDTLGIGRHLLRETGNSFSEMQPPLGDSGNRRPEKALRKDGWRRALTLFVTLTTMTVASALGALYFLVSGGA